MKCLKNFRLLLLTGALLYPGPLTLHAQDKATPKRSHVLDHAELFSDHAQDQAELDIHKMKQAPPGKELVVETIKSIHEGPPSWVSSVQKMVPSAEKIKDAEIRENFFEDLGKHRLEELNVKGVYVLICLDPEHVQVNFSPDTDGLLSESTRVVLQRKFVNCLKLTSATVKRNKARGMLNKFREYRPDYGLRRAVEVTRSQLINNRPENDTVWIWSAGTLLGSGILWTLFTLIQYRSRKKGPEVSNRTADDMSLPVAPLGGATGAVAGEWLFRRLDRKPKGGSTPTIGYGATHLPETRSRV